jgi:hypothetical protein
VIFTAALWILNFKFLPKNAPGFSHPGAFAKLALGISWLCYVALMVAYLWTKMRG